MLNCSDLEVAVLRYWRNLAGDVQLVEALHCLLKVERQCYVSFRLVGLVELRHTCLLCLVAC